MSEPCLNARCDNEVPVIGVCFACANSNFDPRKPHYNIDSRYTDE